MAQPPSTSDAFMREVDDELRRDQLARAWRRWGAIGVATLVALLLAFAGWLYWDHRSAQRAGVDGEQLQTAYDQLAAGQAKEADATLATLAESRGDGYRALAGFAQADELLGKADAKGAVAKFAAIAADASIGQPFRDLALIRQTVVEFDTLPPQSVVERLRSLAAPGSPWFGTAGELTAIAYLRQGRKDLAGKLFGQVAKDETVPPSLRQRAVQMASQMGVDTPSARDEPTSPSGVTPQP